AKLLEQQAARLRELASAIHRKQVQTELVKALQAKEEDIDLVSAALLIAKLDNDEVDSGVSQREVERMARDLNASFSHDVDEAAKIAALNKYLFAERGFHGSRGDYYSRANRYIK